MRILVIFCFLVLGSTISAQAASERLKSRARHSGSSISGDRSYATPGTTFSGDLRTEWGNRSLPQHFSPWNLSLLDGPLGWGCAQSRRFEPRFDLRLQHGAWRARWTAYPQNQSCSINPLYGQAQWNRYQACPAWECSPNERPQVRYWTAAPQPEYGYWPADGINDGRYASAGPEYVYNDYRQYNYYAAPESAVPQPVKPAAPMASRETTTAESVSSQAGPNNLVNPSVGSRFTQSSRISTPEGMVLGVIRDGSLYAGPEAAKPTRLSENVDRDFGCFLAWTPAGGSCAVFREGNQLWTASLKNGEWWKEPLSHEVDFRQSISLGMVGSQPWLVFSTLAGDRFVLAFGATGWKEVGSGSVR